MSNTSNRKEALSAFVSNANEIARMAHELAEIAEDHFNMGPDEITWANVGDVKETADRLREILDRINGEGEYADPDDSDCSPSGPVG